MLEARRGQIAAWTRKPDARGFGIFRMERQLAPFIGSFSKAMQVGDEVAVMGTLKTHPRYGDQFAVAKVVLHLPCEYNLAEWLLQKLPNIGPVRARAIEEAFGQNIWRVIENEPEKLLLIDGITEDRVKLIVSAYEQERASIEVFTRLMQLGVDPKVILQLLRKEVPAKELQAFVDTDPFQLLKFESVTFAHCDEIAVHSKITRTDPRRVVGFVVSLLRAARQDGHTYVHWNAIKMEARTALKITDKAIVEALCESDITKMPYPAPIAYFGESYLQWRELADADYLFAQTMGHTSMIDETMPFRPDGKPCLRLIQGGAA